MTASLITRTVGSPRATRFFFDRVAPIYRWLTNNPMWVGSLHEMARHFPPSRAQLTLLDVGCGHGNSSRKFLELRPDVRVIGIDFAASMLTMAQRMTQAAPPDVQQRARWSQADVTRLPFPNSSVDAITGHSVYYMLGDREGFLRECWRVLRPGGRLILLDPAARSFPADVLNTPHALRVKIAVMAWHAVSRMHQRYTLEQMAERLSAGGFARVLAEKAVEGYGILSRGEKPFPQGLTTTARVDQTAAQERGDLHGIDAAHLFSDEAKGRYLFLLVRQTPDKPPWAVQPGERVTWTAAMVDDADGVGHLLAFSSLPKAVQFMQPAVTANLLIGVNKVAKFDKSRALTWGGRALLNPPFEALLGSSAFRFAGRTLNVDPTSAVTGEE
jgi:ubiquinone/menaquinone biosynthesis C-methylase UbiE